MTNLSQWFDLAEQKPWEVGVYEVQRADYDYAGQFSLFKNGCFHEVGVNGPDSAVYWAEEGGIGDGCDVVLWRGLSTKPEVKKKPANKRKQFVIVMEAAGENLERQHPVGVFEDEKNADAFLEIHQKRCPKFYYYKSWTPPFRTPE